MNLAFLGVLKNTAMKFLEKRGMSCSLLIQEKHFCDKRQEGVENPLAGPAPAEEAASVDLYPPRRRASFDLGKHNCHKLTRFLLIFMLLCHTFVFALCRTFVWRR